MRVFAAVEIPEDVRAAVAAAARELFRDVRDAKLVARENLHVTIRFLGEVKERDLDAVLVAARESASASTSSRAEVRGFGAFPNARRPSVVWAGVDDPTGTTSRLEAEMSRRVEPLGFLREARPFAPHVTVARLRRPRSSLRLVGSSPGFGSLAIETFTVFSSELTPRGSRYTALGRFPLQPTSSKEQP